MQFIAEPNPQSAIELSTDIGSEVGQLIGEPCELAQIFLTLSTTASARNLVEYQGQPPVVSFKQLGHLEAETLARDLVDPLPTATNSFDVDFQFAQSSLVLGNRRPWFPVFSRVDHSIAADHDEG